MRIGLAATGTTLDRVIAQAQRAEEDGFCGLWFTSAAVGDPHIAMVLAANATSRIEVGTAILQTYPCHPVLQAGQAIAVASAIGSGRFTLGLGPSHRPVVEGMLGLSYETPGRHTEEYIQIVTALLRGERVDVVGEEYQVHAGPLRSPGEIEVPVLVAALGTRLLRVAGQYASGTIPWMATARAIEHHVSPRVRRAAAEAGRPTPRIAAGLPVAVHDDIAEAREVANATVRRLRLAPQLSTDPRARRRHRSRGGSHRGGRVRGDRTDRRSLLGGSDRGVAGAVSSGPRQVGVSGAHPGAAHGVGCTLKTIRIRGVPFVATEGRGVSDGTAPSPHEGRRRRDGGAIHLDI